MARTLIGTFTSLAADDERWPAKIKVLSHFVQHHLEEEESVLFQSAEQVLDQEQFRSMQAKMEEVKRDPFAEGTSLRPRGEKDTR